jgi:hypothetical protein
MAGSMSIIQTVYASAPAQYVILPTLEILVPGEDAIRVVAAYEDVTATLETAQTVTFLAGPFEFKRPEKSTRGNQTLTISIANVTGEAQKAVQSAMDSGLEVPVIYREYLSTDLTAPAINPIKMTLRGGTFQGIMVQIEAGYYDLLGTAWPRKRYLADFSPGLRYL